MQFCRFAVRDHRQSRSLLSDSRRQCAKVQTILRSVHSLLFAALLFCPEPCKAADQAYETLSTPRFTLYIEKEKTAGATEPRVQSLASESIEILNKNFEELSRIFSTQPAKRVVLRFLSPDEFHRQTGAPSWTSAMFYRGEITVPVAGKTNRNQLSRALRHEYVHAVVAELSGNKCPAWLDEGLAQLIEGKPNPVLGPALRKWIENDTAMPLSWLESGFTTLDDSLVPAAYAQSLFATRTLVNSHGFDSIRRYLQALQGGESTESAFRTAFGKSQTEFETQLAQQLVRWASSSSRNP